jgi:molecular chaperone DnaK (HSP70)
MIEEDLVRTMESVNKALKDGAMLPSAINKIILVGGSTRIPRISQMLEEKIGHLPHSEIDPDLCVAIGAGMQAGREMGLERSGVLVDITPYTFGTSVVGDVDGEPNLTMFVPLIRRNTRLPARKSEVFYTMVNNQEAVDVKIYQGEAPDALDNILLGNYMFNLTRAPSGSKIILHFDLDLNGILKIKAVEKKTGNKINAVIENAISRFTDKELSQTQDRINGLWTEGRESETSLKEKAQTEADVKELPPEYADIVRRAEGKLADASEEDRNEND